MYLNKPATLAYCQANYHVIVLSDNNPKFLILCTSESFLTKQINNDTLNAKLQSVQNISNGLTLKYVGLSNCFGTLCAGISPFGMNNFYMVVFKGGKHCANNAS